MTEKWTKVEEWEAALFLLGYYTLRKKDGQIAVDNIPGRCLIEAVINFQADFGLDQTGEVDDRTEKALHHALAYGMENTDHQPDNPPEVPEWEDPDEPSVWDDPYIARYLPRNEWMCPNHHDWCGGFPVEPHPDLVRAAANLRKRAVAKVPTTAFVISSGVRCQAHNDELPGSVPDSRHVRGRAVDFSLPGISPAETLKMALETPGIVYAYIMKSGWVHMDIGN